MNCDRSGGARDRREEVEPVGFMDYTWRVAIGSGMMTGIEMMRWGTWEELVLGGAVLRHGTRAWDAVASELQTRSLYPYIFTPEACKAKYEDLQQRFFGCNAWFEELRKQRVAELKRELEKSEDSIGSLQSKLESLIAEKGENFEYDSCQPESYVRTGNEGFTGKERSKDGLSAGSFTEETRRDWSLECQIPAASPQETEQDENEGKTELSEDSEMQKSMGNDGSGTVFRKVRGRRKRRRNPREVSAGESDVLSCANGVGVGVAEESTEGCGWNVRSSGKNNGASERVEDVNLPEFLNSVMEQEHGSIFRRRLDSQKRARYKKMIKRHLDMDTIRSRVDQGSCTNIRELFRDLLLLFNNALTYYPKTSPEYASACALREFTTKKFREIAKNPLRNSGEDFALPDRPNNPVKPPSTQMSDNKVPNKVARTGNPVLDVKKSSNVVCPAASLAKRGVGRPARNDQEKGEKRPEAMAKARKKGRRS